MNRMLGICVLLLAAGMMVAGCAPSRPDWLQGKSSLYPSDAYLTGTGFDKSREKAEDRARNELAKVFRVRVQSRTSIEESALLTRIGAVEREEYSQSAASRVETSTDKVLKGARIAEIWEDADKKQIYALAVLDRLPATRNLRAELEDIDRLVAHQVKMAESTDNPVKQLAHYLKGIDIIANRADVAGDLQIVDPAGWANKAPVTRADLIERAENTARSIKIYIDLEDDDEGIVDGALVRALNEVGMRVVADGDQNLTLRGRVALDEYQANSPLNWVVASAQVDFIAADDSRFDSARVSIRESSQIRSRAVTMAYEKAGDTLASYLVERIRRLAK